VLTTVLQVIATNAVLSHADLAEQLHIGKDPLEKILENLACKGYLTLIAKSDVESHHCCGKCGNGKACTACSPSHDRAFAGWALTAKGRAAAARRQA
jgi:hypothetical protein